MADAVPENNDFNFLKSARDIAFVVAVFLYFAGWMYIYFYLDSFGLPVKAADPDLYGLLIFSANVFIYSYNQYKFWLIVIFVLYIALHFWHYSRARLNWLAPVIIVSTFVFIFCLSRKAALYDADNVKLNSAQHLKSIRFIWKPEILEKSKLTAYKKTDTIGVDNEQEKTSIYQLNDTVTLRLLAVNKDEYYVLPFLRPLTKCELKSYSPTIHVIKKESVEFVNISN